MWFFKKKGKESVQDNNMSKEVQTNDKKNDYAESLVHTTFETVDKKELRESYDSCKSSHSAISPDLDALKEFCILILGKENEQVYNRCQYYLENTTDDFGGISDILYVLSGQDTDLDENIADEDKQLIKSQYYLISSDAGAPCLDDFFWFIEDGIKTARCLDFTLDKEKFSDDDCIIEWLAELSHQLDGLYIINFDGASEDYHFTIMNKPDCEKAMNLFKRMTAHIMGYTYNSFLITEDFKG